MLDDVTKIIKPFEDAVISSFYDIFQGDIRLVMTALRDALAQFPDSFSKTLTVDEAIILLGRERMAHVEKHLTDDKLRVLDAIVKSTHPITQVELATILGKQQTNMSSYFKKLAELGIIEVKREEGRHKFWYLTKEYLPLQYINDAHEKLRESFIHQAGQITLFRK
jgi:predicted transcriptional regulator